MSISVQTRGLLVGLILVLFLPEAMGFGGFKEPPPIAAATLLGPYFEVDLPADGYQPIWDRFDGAAKVYEPAHPGFRKASQDAGLLSRILGLIATFLSALWVVLELSTTIRGIARPPGVGLLAISQFFPKKMRVEILEPTIRDLQDEYIEALAEYRNTGRELFLWKAQVVVRIRGYWSFSMAVLAQIPLSTLKMIVSIWKLV